MAMYDWLFNTDLIQGFSLDLIWSVGILWRYLAALVTTLLIILFLDAIWGGGVYLLNT